MLTRSEHTDDRADAAQFELWRSMTPAERARLADELTAATRSMAVAGIRLRQPMLSDRDVTRELVRRAFGDDLASAAFPEA